jgi:hypothetical protein
MALPLSAKKARKKAFPLSTKPLVPCALGWSRRDGGATKWALCGI